MAVAGCCLSRAAGRQALVLVASLCSLCCHVSANYPIEKHTYTVGFFLSPEVCSDNYSFRDQGNLYCNSWVGYDCKTAIAAYGYTQEGQDALLQNCKSTCGVCQASKVDSLEKLARAVADPTSDQYGEYLTQEKLRDAIGIPVGKGILDLFAMIPQLTDGAIPKLSVQQDFVSVTTTDWLSTYNLGTYLMDYNFGQLILGPEAGVELVVTPGAPDGICKNHTNSSKSACEDAGPCTWSEDKDWKNCTGDSAGWICWPERVYGKPATWYCLDQYNMSLYGGEGGDAAKAGPRKGAVAEQPRDTEKKYRQPSRVSAAMRRPDGIEHRPRADVWKERRRGRAASDAEAAAPWNTLEISSSNTSNSSNSSNKTKAPHWRFRVTSRSRSLELLVVPHNITWTSIEFGYRQLGIRQSVLIKPSDCSEYTHYAQCSVNAVPENQRAIDMMAVCMGLNDTLSAPAGCYCLTNKSVDALGRPCGWLRGDVPSKTPISFVLPYDFASPAAVREDMGIPAGLTQMVGANLPSQAVGEFSYQTFGMDDLELSTKLFGLNPALLNVSLDTPHLNKVRGGNAGEGSLDVQFITALAPGAPTTWIGIDPFNMDGFMLAYMVHLNSQPSPPLVHSISWGDGELYFPQAFIKRMDYEVMKLALRGLTILISSGDNGISSGGPSCAYVPDLSISEWTTSVGATMRSKSPSPYCSSFARMGLGQSSETGQEVCSTRAGAIITSSGGFSLRRPRPAYQKAAVDSYISWMNQTHAANKVSISCYFPGKSKDCRLGPMMVNNRAYPDISAPGHSYPVIIQDQVGMYDGTSASAPVVAAMVTLLNAEQARRGQPPLGLVNPWLYQVHAKHPEAFTDVTVGAIDSTERYLCKAGFHAAPGWDAATGLGVPQFDKLKGLLPSRKPKTSATNLAQSTAAEQGKHENVTVLSEGLGQPAAGSSALLMAFFAGGALAVIAIALLLQQTRRWSQKASARSMSGGKFQQPLL